jgi:hypothetical protein
MASPTLTPCLRRVAWRGRQAALYGGERENDQVGNKPFSCFLGQERDDKAMTPYS